MKIIYHGTVNCLTGSYHQLNVNPQTTQARSYLIDWGLFKALKRQVKHLILSPCGKRPDIPIPPLTCAEKMPLINNEWHF